MKRLLVLLLLSPLSAVAREDTVIVPGKSVGPITAKFTRADLVKAFGAANVKDAPISLGEGETTPGVVVYPKDNKRRLEITWVKSKRVGDVRISGLSSAWRINNGITLGTPLARLQELNGRPFKFSGFDWDYGGNVTSWEGGKLERGLKNVWLTLTRTAPFEGFIGDEEFRSSDALAQKRSIAVGEIRVELNREQ